MFLVHFLWRNGAILLLCSSDSLSLCQLIFPPSFLSPSPRVPFCVLVFFFSISLFHHLLFLYD